MAKSLINAYRTLTQRLVYFKSHTNSKGFRAAIPGVRHSNVAGTMRERYDVLNCFLMTTQTLTLTIMDRQDAESGGSPYIGPPE